ncbi:MAG: HU family DNA-binding protein [Dehalococcoidia bacterium]|nr:HU family DNA-binding protein [Dehalococcoidia bacterium]
MTKADLVAVVAAQAGTSAADAEKVLNGFRDVVQAKLKAGDEVSYPGLGKFSRVERKARTGRNPQTGEAIKVKASKAPKFTAAAGLKQVVNGQGAAPKLKK